MVVVTSRKLFGGGPYSVAGSNALRTVGKKRWPVSEISIQPPKALTRDGRGVVQRQHTPPFMPKSIREPYHPGGNSLCYMIQTAHLMGCNPIYCLGFTLVSGTGYFFGLENPATRKRSFYSDPDRALEWLRWYESRWPGRARLWPGWSGPVYDVLEVVDAQELQQRVAGHDAPNRARQQPVSIARNQPNIEVGRSDDRHKPVAHRRDVQEVERLRQPEPRKPVHQVRKQPVRGKVIGGR